MANETFAKQKVSATQQRILLSSTAADRYLINESRTDLVSFDLNEPVVCKSNQRIYLSLETFAFPNTIYNVNADNNTITFHNPTTPVTVTIPVGQYTTPELFRSAIQTAIPITVTYNSLTNKFSFQNTSATNAFILKTSSTMAYALGVLPSTDFTVPVSSTVVLPRQIDISSGRTVNFAVRNLDFDCLDSSGSKTLSSILATVPINVGYGSIQSYISPYDNRIKINAKNITSLDISLIDLNNNPVDIGGLRWSAVILVSIE